MFRHTLITVLSGHQAFTEAASCLAVAGIASMDCSQRAAGARLAPFRRVAQSVMRLFAALAAFSLHVCFAAALTGDETNMNIGQSVTDSSVQRAQRVTVTKLADVGVSDVSLWVLEVKRFTLFTVVSRRVVFTVIADATAEVS